jgi:hypothetical protein
LKFFRSRRTISSKFQLQQLPRFHHFTWLELLIW